MVLAFIETDSLVELDACRPLSLAERDSRLDWLERIRHGLRVEGRILVLIGTDDPATSLKFEIALPPRRDDAEHQLETVARVLDIADFAKPWQGWIDLDPSEIVLRSPVDLANLLKLAMKRSGLGAGQLSNKTGIPRSQVYLLTKSERGSLPRSQHQIRRFLRACRVPLEIIETVMAQWIELRSKSPASLATLV